MFSLFAPKNRRRQKALLHAVDVLEERRLLTTAPQLSELSGSEGFIQGIFADTTETTGGYTIEVDVGNDGTVDETVTMFPGQFTIQISESAGVEVSVVVTEADTSFSDTGTITLATVDPINIEYASSSGSQVTGQAGVFGIGTFGQVEVHWREEGDTNWILGGVVDETTGDFSFDTGLLESADIELVVRHSLGGEDVDGFMFDLSIEVEEEEEEE